MAPQHHYELTAKLLASEEGKKQLKEINFVAYVLNILDEAQRLRVEHDLEVFTDEDFLVPFLSNPNVAKFWNDPGLKHWYSEEFQRRVEELLAKQSAGTRTGSAPITTKR
jgi:hypothetical protein